MFDNSPLFFEVASVIGSHGAFLLFRAYAGKRLYIPAVASQHKLKDLLGEEAFSKLVYGFAGSRLDLPTGNCGNKLPRVEESTRDSQIRKLKAKGFSNQEISERVGVTRRSVCFTLNSKRVRRDNQCQLSIFDYATPSY